MNKTSISSVVCLDIIDFAKKSDAEQKAALAQFNTLVDLAVVDIPQEDRLIVKTGHGAIITCSGPLENALEDALFIALTVRDEVLSSNSESDNALYLHIGINLGSVKIAESANINDAPNIIGDGLVEAQRIMSFANPNQILVSRAYYDMASKLTLEIAQMFEKYDMHAYEHDIYAVRRLSEKAAAESAAIADSIEPAEESSTNSSVLSWSKYVLPLLLGIAILFSFTKWMNKDKTVEIVEQPVITTPAIEEAPILETSAEENKIEQDATQDAIVQEDSVEKRIEKKSVEKKKVVTKKPIKKSDNTQEPKSGTADKSKVEEPVGNVGQTEPVKSGAESNQTDKKSGWETFKESIKQGTEKECTQAERALNQCN